MQSKKGVYGTSNTISQKEMFDNAIKFHSTNTLILKNGALDGIGDVLSKLGVSKALIVTDSVLSQIGMPDSLIEKIPGKEIGFTMYNGVLPEPPVENVNDALNIYNDQQCDGVIGLGGGSSIDVAKAVAMLATNGGKYEDYVGIGNVPKKCAPLVLIPTTSGTGSEVSIFSIMLVNGGKMGVVDENILGDVALVDPLLTKSVPRKVTAATGLDALCHHIESFLSVNSSPYCDLICLEGIRVIGKYLLKAFGHGENENARYWMSYASTLGGFVMNLTEGAAANHGLAFALGAKFHIGHGLSNAVMLPHVFPVVGKAEYEKVRQIGEALGEDVTGLSNRGALDVVTNALSRLVSDVGCFIPLADFGVRESDIDALVAETETQTRVLNHSTYTLTSEEIKDIFMKAL